MLGMKRSDIVATLVDLQCPSSLVILFGLDDLGRCPNGQLHGVSVPFHEYAEFLSWCVCWPLLWEREKGEMVRPMR